MHIVIANDHGAVSLKKELQAWLEIQGHAVVNLGIDAEDRIDYPDVAEKACAEYAKGCYDFGVLLCGTGIGISIAANKIPGIRCALVHNEFTAAMAREHNDANFIAMGGRVEYVVPPTRILAAFMAAKFEGGRHADRVAKIAALDAKNRGAMAMASVDWAQGLEPEAVWSRFAFICGHPHPSRGEGALADAIVARERARGIEAERDGAGNVILRKPATKGMEDRRGLILQAHLDMVAQAATGIVHDFARDPIRPRFEKTDPAWLRASGTTLGADNGIGVAAAMALVESDDLPHGPLEALLTLCEEDGMIGARGLQASALRGELLVNLDSEDEDEICIGCAGGARLLSSLSLPAAATSGSLYELCLSGLLGGHSGVDIHLGRGNAIRLLAGILRSAGGECALAAYEGGSVANAIPRDARALVIPPQGGDRPAWEAALYAATQAVKAELGGSDPGLELAIAPFAGGLPAEALSPGATRALLDLVLALPQGVIAMSETIPGLTATSCSLGIARLTAEAPGRLRFEATSVPRSESDADKEKVIAEIVGLVTAAGGTSELTTQSPAWTPDPESPLLALACGTYRELFRADASVRATHGGLETGLFRGVFPSWDMISIGPSIRFPHSPDEAVRIESVSRFWRLLTGIAARAPSA